MDSHPLDIKNRSIRIFVSSTFKDMQAERDELVKYIFPQLRKLCDQRAVTWDEVDLRWGITDEQSAEGKVLPICLNEIKRSRPFFIGILGERYGWELDEIPSDIANQEPWIAQHLGHSITELEILHGVLNNPEMAKHSYFYFRDPGYIDTLPADQQDEYRESPIPEEIEKYGLETAFHRANERQEKLFTLKNRIIEDGFPVEMNYKDPRALGKLVLRDMTATINRLYPAGSEPSPLEREISEHEAFAASRVALYIGGSSYFEQLNAHASQDGPPLVVLGEPGSGKSALLANWALRYRDSHPDDLVIMNFIGASRFSTDQGAILRRIIGELKQHFDIPVDMPDETSALPAVFANALHMAAVKGRVILILDALDQIEDRDGAPDLLWLPVQIPPNVRIVLSTLPGRPLDALKTRGWPTLQVKPLTPSETRELAREYLAGYSKSLSSEQMEKIVAAPLAGIPIWVRVLCEELRIFGKHEELDRYIDHYLAASTIPDLFAKILARYERDYERDRPGLVRDAMVLLWGARRGLSEAELMDLLGREGEPLPRQHWSALYLAMDQSLVNRSGLFSFSHDYFRQAILKRYLRSEKDRRITHLALAKYFESRDLGDRIVEELLWQLHRAGALEELGKKLQNLQLVKIAMDRNRYDVFEYVRAVEERTNLDRSQLLADIIESPIENLAYIDSACLLLANGRLHETALHILQKSQEYCLETGQRSKLAEFLGYEFDIRKHAIRVDPEGKLAKTPTRTLERKVAIQRDLGMTDAVVDSLEEISAIELRRKNKKRAMALLREAEKVARDAGNSYNRLRLLSRQSGLYWNDGDIQAALHLHNLAFSGAAAENDRDAISDLCLQAGAYALALGDDRAERYLAHSVRVIYEIGDIEQAASRLQAVGDRYLRSGKRDYHRQLGLSLLKESRRLYTLLGSQRGTISPVEQLLQGAIQSGHSTDKGSEPSLERFWGLEINWPIPPLSPKEGHPGRLSTWWMVSPDTVETCKKNVRYCSTVLLNGKHVLERLDIGFAYDALLYLLSEIRRTPTHQRPDQPTRKEAIIHIAMMGNWELHDGFDPGDGVYQYLTDTEVKIIRRHFSRAKRRSRKLAANYDARKMDLLKVYPGGWEEMGDEGLEYVSHHFGRLLDFFTRASKQKAYVICGMWGPSCVEAVRRSARTGKYGAAGVPRRSQQMRPGKRVRTSPAQVSPQWFRTTGGAGGTIDIECKHCHFATFFEARHGEVPPSRCPKCGAE